MVASHLKLFSTDITRCLSASPVRDQMKRIINTKRVGKIGINCAAARVMRDQKMTHVHVWQRAKRRQFVIEFALPAFYLNLVDRFLIHEI